MKLLPLALIFLSLVLSGSSVLGGKVLALLENLAIKETHSIFFKKLTDTGMDITYKVADDPSIVIKQ